MTPPAAFDPSMSTDCLARGTRTPRDHDRALLPATPLRASAPRPARAALPQPPTHPAPTPRPVTQSASDAMPPCSPRRTNRLPHASTATPHTAQPFASLLLTTDRAGVSSSTTCAFVPLMPNDDTPARRTRDAARGHARAS